MDNQAPVNRPSYEEIFKAWKALLDQRGLPGECVWVFAENLCFEREPSRPGAVRVGYQVAFMPPPKDSELLAYDLFAETNARVVLYRLGTANGKSVCAVLCDDWFETQGEAQGYVRRDDWRVSFRPGEAVEVPEIADIARWKQRLLRGRPRHDLDFCLSLRAIHELLAHGRVLTTYERYALRFFHVWWRMLGTQPAQPDPKAAHGANSK